MSYTGKVTIKAWTVDAEGEPKHWFATITPDFSNPTDVAAALIFIDEQLTQGHYIEIFPEA